MSLNTAGGDALGRIGDEASPSVSPSMEGVLPIRGVDGNTGEAIRMDAAPGLREADDPFRADVVRWETLDVPSIMVEEDLTKLREAYRIPADIELMIPGPNERAFFSRRGCTALHLNAFVSRMCLPLHPMFRMILRAYGMAPIQPRKLSKKKGKEEEVGWYYFCPWGSHKPLVTGYPSSIKQWKESWFWVFGNWQRVHDDPEPDLDVSSFYGIATEMDQGRRPWPTLACLSKQRPKVLVPGSAEDTSQRKVIEDLSGEGNRTEVAASDVVEIEDTGVPEGEVPLKRKRKDGASGSGPSQSKKKVELVDNYTVCAPQPFQRTLSVNPSGEVVLDSPPRADLVSGGSGVVPFDSKKKLRELIGPPRSRISDDTLRNVPFFPSMEAQDVKKYLTPKWEEFASHGELEDVLEASLATAVRVTSLQMKVLGEFRTCMQEHKKLVAEASKSEKEPQQSLEGLQVAVDSMRTAYKQLQADLRESDSNFLQLTKQLDNANAAQKVAAEALEAANLEKRRLLSESECRDLEFQRLRGELEVSERGRTEAEAEVTRLPVAGREEGNGGETRECGSGLYSELPQYRGLHQLLRLFCQSWSLGGLGRAENRMSRPRPWAPRRPVSFPRG
ncbi:Uncharacterized protein Adt_29883 [Abeliophyllum distichum]|uniref:Aminotransferase-like plant mobile domain-containing protein n=1 Tax=Abeliophyllum distichum TaxID=126358 RepID=A0ABD1R9P0_9LAMI